MKQISPYAIGFLGLGCILSLAITMYYVFLNAWFSTSKGTLVLIDAFGEANIEFVLFPLCIALGMFGIYMMFLLMKKNRYLVSLLNHGQPFQTDKTIEKQVNIPKEIWADFTHMWKHEN